MYTYRMPNKLSDKVANIYHDGEIVGSINRHFSHLLFKFVENIISTNFTNRYRMRDAEGNIVMEAKMHLHPMKKRQYDIHYYDGEGEHYLHLSHQKMFELGNSAVFTYEHETYDIYKPIAGWGEIKKNEKTIAKWRGKMKFPFEAEFETTDKEYEHLSLLFLGVFHTFCYS